MKTTDDRGAEPFVDAVAYALWKSATSTGWRGTPEHPHFAPSWKGGRTNRSYWRRQARIALQAYADQLADAWGAPRTKAILGRPGVLGAG